MKYVLTNYEADCSWVTSYTSDYIIYDRSECGLPNRIPRENVGDADYDKLTYLVDNYDELPDVFLWSKSNLWKFITKEEFELVKDNTTFTPLLTQNHKVYEPICRYTDGVYEEVNNGWYLHSVPPKYVNSWQEWASIFQLPSPDYIPFAPGGSYILTRDVVHKHPKELYERMRDMLPWSIKPGEAQLAERSYYLLWN